MTEFPTIVYKDGGTHQRPGGTYSWAQAVDEEAYRALLKDGYCATLEEAINPSPVSVADDDGAPTREEIEAKCAELGIKVHHKTKDETLLLKIEEKLSELDQETVS